jgi:hypothetical protein
MHVRLHRAHHQIKLSLLYCPCRDTMGPLSTSPSWTVLHRAAADGNTSVIAAGVQRLGRQWLLRRTNDAHHLTVLDVAALFKRTEVVTQILTSVVTPSPTATTTDDSASQEPAVASPTLSGGKKARGAPISRTTSPLSGRCCLHHAVLSKDANVVRIVAAAMKEYAKRRGAAMRTHALLNGADPVVGTFVPHSTWYRMPALCGPCC